MSQTERKNFFLSILKGVLFAVVFSLVAVLLFAFLIKAFSLSSSIILPVVECLKVASVLGGCLFGVGKEKGLLTGLTIGVLSIAASYLLFFAIGGEGRFSLLALAELLLGGVVGGFSGIIAMNIRK